MTEHQHAGPRAKDCPACQRYELAPPEWERDYEAKSRKIGELEAENERLKARVHDLTAQQQLALKMVPDEMARELPIVAELEAENAELKAENAKLKADVELAKLHWWKGKR